MRRCCCPPHSLVAGRAAPRRTAPRFASASLRPPAALVHPGRTHSAAWFPPSDREKRTRSAATVPTAVPPAHGGARSLSWHPTLTSFGVADDACLVACGGPGFDVDLCLASLVTLSDLELCVDRYPEVSVGLRSTWRRRYLLLFYDKTSRSQVAFNRFQIHTLGVERVSEAQEFGVADGCSHVYAWGGGAEEQEFDKLQLDLDGVGAGDEICYAFACLWASVVVSF
eukprot:TsM_000281300 transcript=TsM_000281300 gene=TsM_000281300